MTPPGPGLRLGFVTRLDAGRRPRDRRGSLSTGRNHPRRPGQGQHRLHTAGDAGGRSECGARVAAGRGGRAGLCTKPGVGAGRPRGRQGAGPGAVLARSRELGDGDGGADARGRRRPAGLRAAARPLWRRAGGRAGAAARRHHPHRAHGLHEPVRHRHRACRRWSWRWPSSATGRRGRARAPPVPSRCSARSRAAMAEAAGVSAAPERPATARARVLVKERIAEGGVELLRERFDVDVEIDMPADELADRIAGYDAPDRAQRDHGRRRPAGAGRAAEGDRPGRHRRRQRRRRRGHPPRHHRRQRPRLEHGVRRRARDRTAAVACPQHPAGAFGAQRRHAGSAPGSAGSRCTARRSASSASAASASWSPPAHAGWA